MTALSPELRAFVRPGLAGTIATADGAQRPYGTRVWAVRLLGSGSTLELYVLRAPARAFLGAVATSARAAANLIEVSTYRSRAFKGQCSVSPEAIDAEHLRDCLRAADVVFQAVGMGPEVSARMLGHYEQPREMVALRLEVDAVYDQSPKPGAGARL